MNVQTKCNLYGIYRDMKPNEIKPENEQKEELIPKKEPETRFIPLAGEKIESSLDILDKIGRAMVEGGHTREVNEPDGEKVSGDTTKSEENISPRNGEVSYDAIITEAQNLNKELWSSVSQFLEEYGFNNSIDFSSIGDNPNPNDPRFTVLKELGERLTKEEWLIIKDMVDELIEMLSKAHELNGFSMDGEENQLKHPVQYGIIANIIDPLRYLYE